MLRPVEIAEKLLRLVQHKHTHDRRTPSPPAGHNHGDVSSKNVTIRRHHLRLPWVIAVVGWGVLVVAGCGRSRSVDPQSLRRGDQVEVSVVGVHDGDTLTGLTVDHHQVKVRLEGIDAPELGQPFGKAAKRALSEKAFGNGVKIMSRATISTVASLVM